MQEELALRFLRYVEERLGQLPKRELAELVEDAGGSERVLLAIVDMLAGFATEGPLASPRVKGLVPGIAALQREADRLGVPTLFANDQHPDDAVEFAHFPPHCIKGTSEAELVEGLAREGDVLAKSALCPWLGTPDGPAWLDRIARDIRTVIVVGDCTDLCVYQTAMPLKMWANNRNMELRIVVPARQVQTFDILVDAAREADVLAHDGDLYHTVFLYHMLQNGIDVVQEVT